MVAKPDCLGAFKKVSSLAGGVSFGRITRRQQLGLSDNLVANPVEHGQQRSRHVIRVDLVAGEEELVGADVGVERQAARSACAPIEDQVVDPGHPVEAVLALTGIVFVPRAAAGTVQQAKVGQLSRGQGETRQLADVVAEGQIGAAVDGLVGTAIPRFSGRQLGRPGWQRNSIRALGWQPPGQTIDCSCN